MSLDRKRTYETKELLAYVRSCGFKVNEDLLRDFQKQGLMSYPVEKHSKRSSGRVKGVYGIWTEQQRNLLRTLCMMKEKHKWKPSQSCNLPVWVWLYWGDEYGVTFDQVKRSMCIWASHFQKQLSQDRSRQAASQVVKQVRNYKGGQRIATNKIAEAFYNGGYTQQDISDALHYAFDETKPKNGPSDFSISPESMGRYFDLWNTAAEAIKKEQISRVHWEWARCFHLTELANYLKEQPRYAEETKGSSVEHLFTADTIESLWSSTCADLAAVIGLGLEYPSMPHVPETLRLDVWKRKVKSAAVTSEIQVSPLFLPNGTHPTCLKIVETVTLLSPEEISLL